MVDKSAFVPLDAAGTGKPRPAELDIDVDDNDYFGGSKAAPGSAPAPGGAPAAGSAPNAAGAGAQNAAGKKPIVYQKAKGYQKTYAYKNMSSLQSVEGLGARPASAAHSSVNGSGSEGWWAPEPAIEDAGSEEGWGARPERPEDEETYATTEGSGRLACQEDEFLREIDDIVFSSNPVAIITAKPGTGKSSILPVYLAVQYDGHVVISEPRIVAVDKLYSRALELKHRGRADFEVLRCTRRTDDVKGACRRGAKARLIFATDGKIVNRNLHSAVFGVFEDQRCVFKSFLVIDEIHEMNLNMEIMLSKARDYISTLHSVGQGHEFQLFIISATIQQIGEVYKNITDFFTSYGIEPYYRKVPYEPPFTNHIEFSAENMTFAGDDYEDFPVVYRVERKVDQIRKAHPDAGIMIFVSSLAVAEALRGRLIHLYKHRPERQIIHVVFRATVTPIRDEALGRGVGKTIICSNIAELSITVEDIDFVIDTGLVRRGRNYYELDTLYEEPISQAEAIHRAGRVGRLNTGRVIRLYTQAEFEKFPIDPPSQSSLVDARLVAANFCNKMELTTISNDILREKMVTKHEGMTLDTLSELASIGLLTPDEYGKFEVNAELMHLFVSQCTTYAGSYVGMMLSTFNSVYYEPYVAAQALLNAPNLWLPKPSTEMYPQGSRPQPSAKSEFNDGFSEMTTILRVYHKYIQAESGRDFCKEFGIFMDAIYDAELQFASVTNGKDMRMCTNLERAYTRKEEFQAAVAPHMYCAVLDIATRRYKLENVPYFADINPGDAIYISPSNERHRHKRILCDGLISTVRKKYYLVNTMLYPEDKQATPPPGPQRREPQLRDDLNPEWY
ncbi:hypothetical protein QR680_008160 [Steinernema hermaphroditum]|uniref:Helicase C-terminal domain-containing protein n=1 Tax=Steinernema hermaphroditum TaxID=289476 RepID=A0AA39IFM1_9BILA|nr:hypothetical protein QR680_008160 [Steinernema hermaphroditum]